MVSPSRYEWDVHGSCEEPVGVELYGRPEPGADGFVNVSPGSPAPLTVALHLPCRGCRSCLNWRSRVWRERARAEIFQSARTWMATLTLSPENHFLTLTRARHEARKRSVPWDELTENQQFTRRHGEVSKEITLYLKRVRKQAAGRLRFLCVCEKHRTGLPHYHMLIHEIDAESVKYRSLQEQWRLGFSHHKLVLGKEPAAYVAKYLSKSADARVRASVRYGKTLYSVEVKRENLTPQEVALYARRGLTNGISNASLSSALWGQRSQSLAGLSKASDAKTAETGQ